MKDAIPLAPFLSFQALAEYLTIWEQKISRVRSWSGMGAEWPERLIIAGRAIWFYLAKLFWLIPSASYPRWEDSFIAVDGLLPLLGATVAWLVLWLLPGKAGAPRLPPLLCDLTVSDLGFFSVYFFRYSFVSDHFQYLASMGPLALVAPA